MSRNLIGQTLLNQYRVDAFVASGGMGAVYRVWDLKRNAYLAMKVLHDDLLEEPSILKRFQREARALEKLTHPNIVPFYGFYDTPYFAFLLEAYIDGPSLKNIIRGKRNQPFAVKDALAYLKALCPALGYAHTYGVIHCDVKPGNVMLDNGGNIYLADFGIARHAESTTTTFATIGTAPYMAPEQIRGDPVSATTDVYALGILFFELLTGRRPFKGDEKDLASSGTTAGERIRYAHLKVPPPNPRLFNPHISEPLGALVQQTLAKDPQDRPESAMTFYSSALTAAGLSSVLIPDRVPVDPVFTPTPPTVPEIPILDPEISSPDVYGPQKSPTGQKKRGLAIVAVASIFVVMFILLMGSRFTGKSETANTITDLAAISTLSPVAGNILTAVFTQDEPDEGIFPSATPDIPTNTPVVEALPSATPVPSLSPTVTPLPGGVWGKIAYTCQIFKKNQKNQICLMNTDGSNQTRLTTNDDRDHAWPSLSPDGQSMVYAANTTGEYEVYEMDLATRKSTQLTTSLRNSAPVISPDGKSIIYIHKAGDFRQLWLMDRNGSNQRKLIGSDQWGAWDGSWSPDSQQVLFASDKEGGVELYTIDINGSNLNRVTDVTNSFSSNQRLRGRNDWSPNGDWMATYLGTSWNWEIYLIRTDGSESGIITFGGNNLAPSFSPNGEWITFTSYRDRYSDDHGCEIYIMRVDGSNVKRLTDNDYCDWQPRWGS
ncbi:protein kinase [Chloroflexota bacterium]